MVRQKFLGRLVWSVKNFGLALTCIFFKNNIGDSLVSFTLKLVTRYVTLTLQK